MEHEDSRRQCLEAEEEVRCLKSQVQDLSQANARLESQYQHTKTLLKSEINARAKLQEEKKILVEQLSSLSLF